MTTSSASPGGALRAPLWPGHARVHNRALLLSTLFRGGAMSRADLARATGLTRVTVSDVVTGLLREGVVLELGARAPRGPGKPGVVLDLDRTGIEVISIDLSGAEGAHGAVMALDGTVRARIAPRGVAHGDGGARGADVLDLARALRSAASGRVLGVGVTVPGVVSRDGVVKVSPRLGWEDHALGERMSTALGLGVHVVNDANGAAMAAHVLAGAPADLLLVRVAQGVGSAVLVRGEVVRGEHDAAGEIGHVTVGDGSGPECACGRRGCLEAWIAEPRLRAEIADGTPAGVVLRTAGERLGAVLAPLVGVLDLMDVVVVAPRALYGGELLRAATEALRARTLGRSHEDVRVRLMAEGDEIVLRGGLVTVMQREWGVS